MNSYRNGCGLTCIGMQLLPGNGKGFEAEATLVLGNDQARFTAEAARLSIPLHQPTGAIEEAITGKEAEANSTRG